MKPVNLFFGSLLAISILSGCAMTPQSAQMDADEAAQLLSTGPVLPDVELTPELLNDLFIAEIALQRAQYPTAVEYYARLAKQTQDPRLVERATRIAVFAREYQVALELDHQGKAGSQETTDNKDNKDNKEKGCKKERLSSLKIDRHKRGELSSPFLINPFACLAYLSAPGLRHVPYPKHFVGQALQATRLNSPAVLEYCCWCE